jgi:hypothetical protein
LNERKAYFSLRLILAGPAVLDDQQQGFNRRLLFSGSLDSFFGSPVM